MRRADGQTLQLTPLLYAVLQAIDGRRSCPQIAEVVSEAVRRRVTPDTVATLVAEHLRPLGLVALADGSQPPVRRSNPLLGLRFRVVFTDPRTTRRLTDPFRPLFRPLPAVLVVTGFLAVTWWVFFHRGLAPAAYDAFQRPHLLLLVFVVTVLSGGFHEFGHAAAARYGGAQPGVMGAGLYLVWPAFYTDVTDSYRLGRGGRIRTDLGGLYFNAVVVVVTFAWWYAARWDALLLVVATQILQMVSQLMPTLRFDGYHLLADLTGVPDLYHRIRPTLVGLLPHHWSDPHNRVLKPWARAVITAWVLVTVPLMGVMLWALVRSVPRVLGTAWSVVADDAAGVGDAWATHDPLEVATHAFQVPAVVLPVVGGLLILGRVGLRWTKALGRWSRGSARRRAAAVVLLATVVSLLAYAWAPRPGVYRPIRPDDKGLIAQLLPPVRDVDARPVAQLSRAPAGLAAQRRLSTGVPLTATFEEGQALPTRAKPQLALVLVPAAAGTGDAGGRAGTVREPAGAAEPWVFPFDQPLPPGEGDNQALATNTTDGSTVYDVAFALVWVTGDEVENVNEAYAYASCEDCVTVAVAFQVVLIMDDAHVVVPQNLAVAANYDCYRCITAAVASQLVLSVEAEPGEDQLRSLTAVWNQLLHLGQTITSYSLGQIVAQLDAVKEAIVAILGADPQAPATAASASGVPTAPAPTGGSSAPPSSTAPDASSGTPDGVSSGATDGSVGGATSGSASDPASGPATTGDTSAPEPTTSGGSATAGTPTSDSASPEPAPTSASDPSGSP